MGKGSSRRPVQVSNEEFGDNWSHAFRRNDKNMEKNRYKRKKRKNAEKD